MNDGCMTAARNERCRRIVRPSAHQRHVEARRGAAVVGPARRDRLQPRVEAHAVHAMHVQVAEQRVAPAAERVERHRHRNRHVDAGHADFDVLLEPSRRMARAREQRRAVGIRIGVDHRDRIGERFGAHDGEHRTEDLLAIDRHLGRDAIEQRRADEETRLRARRSSAGGRRRPATRPRVTPRSMSPVIRSRAAQVMTGPISMSAASPGPVVTRLRARTRAAPRARRRRRRPRRRPRSPCSARRPSRSRRR